MELGLRDSEAVVRLSPGDYPIVLQGLEKQESAHWIRLSKKDKQLSKFVSGKKRESLNKCTIFDKITDSHRRALAKLLQAQGRRSQLAQHLFRQRDPMASSCSV